MSDEERNEHHAHGGMDHGIGMMVGCLVPMAAILLLPKIGVSPTISIVVGIVGMLALHGGMSLFHKLRNRGGGKQPAADIAGHHH
jgi:hypothetical protein